MKKTSPYSGYWLPDQQSEDFVQGLINHVPKITKSEAVPTVVALPVIAVPVIGPHSHSYNVVYITSDGQEHRLQYALYKPAVYAKRSITHHLRYNEITVLAVQSRYLDRNEKTEDLVEEYKEWHNQIVDHGVKFFQGDKVE